MSESKYYIKAEYCYSAGTFGAPEDGVYTDKETGQQVYDNREAAQNVIDDIDNNTYYLRHGEMERPDLKVRKVRANQSIDRYANLN